ncbi:MAG: N-acylglucosamine 2-epimerase [Clostridiales bacterium]|nr:N-acylglucosamine 2-epimerase [Clostridiales bacterium]
MNAMKNEMVRYLRERLLPFWQSLRDDQNGGYISYVGQDLSRDPMGERGCILNSRILWFFSAASRALGDASLLPYAEHAYKALLTMLDGEHGGVYWSVTAQGRVLDGTKHTYNQAFAIYALSAYAEASGRKEPLALAYQLFDLIESRCTDEIGYLEAHKADWTPESNEKLSENGVMAEKTMNTLLHVLEAYTELYRVDGSGKVKDRILFILHLLEEKIYNPQKRRQEVFFDREYHSLIDLSSFGHDVETSWLADRTLEVLGDEEMTRRIRPMLMDMAQEVYETAFTGDGFMNERHDTQVDTTRIWWVQAEALVGFLNAWEKTGEEKFLSAARSQWQYIKDKMIDPRENSEWFWSVDEKGVPIPGKPIVEPWKCPYHNGRMIFEVMERSSHAHVSANQ